MDLSINITPGPIHWSIFHRVHEQDLANQFHVRKAPKISYQALHPGNYKQSVPLALSIFDPTTITAIRQYFPEDTTTSFFVNLIHNWWLVVNAEEIFHPDVIGSALIANDGKIEFLNLFANWLSDWRDSKKHGLSKQSFDTLISTNRAIADLSADLLNEGYKYILTGRLQIDPLERRFSQYRQMSGGRFLVSLKEVYRSESILKLKKFLSNNIELTSNIASITDEGSSILQDFLETVNQENFDHITISQDAVDVITFVSGYISRSLLNSLDFEVCKIALTNDPVSSTYLDDYNRGGLEIPTSALLARDETETRRRDQVRKFKRIK